MKKKFLLVLLTLASLSMVFATVQVNWSADTHETESISQATETNMHEAEDSHVHFVASGGTKTCSKCKGSGKCTSCNGSGRCHYCSGKGYHGSGKSKVSCSWCSHGKCNHCSPTGSGKCSMCRGDGMVY